MLLGPIIKLKNGVDQESNQFYFDLFCMNLDVHPKMNCRKEAQRQARWYDSSVFGLAMTMERLLGIDVGSAFFIEFEQTEKFEKHRYVFQA